MKDGGDDPFATCPECGEDTYIMEEEQCALCRHKLKHSCERCGSGIPASEMMCSPLCGYCVHMEQECLRNSFLLEQQFRVPMKLPDLDTKRYRAAQSAHYGHAFPMF